MNQNVDYEKVRSFKTKYLIVLSILTVFIILAGTVFRHSAWVDGTFSFLRISTGKQTKVTWNKQDLGSPCRELDISMAYGDINLVCDGREEITYNGPSKLLPKVTAKDGIWTLRQKKQARSVGFLFFSHPVSGKLTLHLPSDEVLKHLSITTQYGDVDVKNLTAENATFHLSCGDLTLKDTTVSTGKVDLSMGDFDLKNCKVSSLDTSLSMGDFSAKNTAFHQLTADLSMGDVSIKSSRDLRDAAMNLSTSLGDINVNRQKSDDEYQTPAKNGSKDSFLIENSMGDIDLFW
jgi:hypothetical protein